ncbi:MAG: SDR family oxidoreductase [Alphaproteobacteria bacterium]|nr:SDR family oxidoreductase [Alphaproteobacteria bacterium]
MPEAFAPDDQQLAGKVAIVSGAGAAEGGIGNGRAASILLARAGAKIVAVDRNLERAAETVSMIEAEGGEAFAHQADTTLEADCAAMVAKAVATYGRVDVLDNNVGIGSSGSVVEESLENWERVMRINVQSMFMAAKFAIPAMIDSGSGGAIVNVSSISALRPRGLTAYSASKGAVISLTRAMAMDHAADGIRANCIAPGPVYTPMVYSRGMSDKAREGRRTASPLGVEGSGWDIGNAVVFLSSARARYITGQTLVVDGGITVAAPARDPNA